MEGGSGKEREGRDKTNFLTKIKNFVNQLNTDT